ncbi:MAG: cob(I)yrinic acid a,c-diamide adenosyltransferase [Deltaproteobacteria bacterium]|nr:MAG: cob(I)yrinic acid a,c-diamide adenosyltransferase [Deltaproteobacteria bacterium]
MRISRVYTRTGDKGTTRLVGNAEVGKNHPRIEAYGTVDELNSVLGLARAHLAGIEALLEVDQILERIQSELFDVGTDLATPAESRWEGMVRPDDTYVGRLEAECDRLNESLPPLKEFILPGGGVVSATLHQGRTVCRRAERRVLDLMQDDDTVGEASMRYLNRLSDLLFVVARYAAMRSGHAESFWQNPNRRSR